MNDPIQILREIVANGCKTASETDGSLSCYFCGEDWFGDAEPHEPTCAYVKAVQFIAFCDELVDTQEPAPKRYTAPNRLTGGAD